jgi:hypothetical protein
MFLHFAGSGCGRIVGIFISFGIIVRTGYLRWWFIGGSLENS